MTFSFKEKKGKKNESFCFSDINDLEIRCLTHILIHTTIKHKSNIKKFPRSILITFVKFNFFKTTVNLKYNSL